jgi:hypothetical protein
MPPNCQPQNQLAIVHDRTILTDQSKCPHEAQASTGIDWIEHGPQFSFGLCNDLAGYITSSNIKRLCKQTYVHRDKWYFTKNDRQV